MTRTLPLCAVLLALPALARSDDQPVPTETVIRLKVQATPASKPALRYLLLPELSEMNPGNPVLGFLKCFSEQNHFFHSKEATEERDKWTEMPLKDLPVAKLRGYGGPALRQADYAARLDNADWQTLLKLRSDGANLLLPEVQQLRDLTHALQVRFRGEIADRRFDDALATAKTMFALSRLLGEHPTIIGSLVGAAMAFITIEPLQELIEQPGCPNLFWALSDLPRPFIDLRRGMQGERLWLLKEFALLDEKAPMTEAQLDKVVNQYQALFDSVFGVGVKQPKQNVRAWVADRATDMPYLQASRKRLVESGLAEDKVRQFPPYQVVLLDGKLTHDVLRDDLMKAVSAPYWQAGPGLLAAEKQLKEAAERARRNPKQVSPFIVAVPHLVKVRVAQARLEQRFALLCCVEALRLHAALHDGKLPARLDDIQLPLPVDPFTGKAFLYKLEAGIAVLRGAPPAGFENSAPYNIRYELSIRK